MSKRKGGVRLYVKVRGSDKYRKRTQAELDRLATRHAKEPPVKTFSKVTVRRVIEDHGTYRPPGRSIPRKGKPSLRVIDGDKTKEPA